MNKKTFTKEDLFKAFLEGLVYAGARFNDENAAQIRLAFEDFYKRLEKTQTNNNN